ncbi:MAG: Asp-tRNA(Asn)/Glu-tRNA(Gln) amidotransferase subunit GatC [Firmicutes bacterium]|nr:Asp-tRNA(Asn)/Glu-tRNA(Gln) amidotransferase subunit GatC [Bacillota bacterium]
MVRDDEPGLTLEQVEAVAAQARLSLSQEEKQRLRGELSDILRMAAELNEVDTEGVEPTVHVLPVTNVFRDDAARPSMAPEEALAGAPDQKDGFFKVPRILDEE